MEMTRLLSELQRDADDEQTVMGGEFDGTYYLVRRLRIIARWEVTPGLPVQVTRYDLADDLESAWAAIGSGRT